MRDVLIAVDRDPSLAGETAARALAADLVARGVRVELVWPPGDTSDFNDWAVNNWAAQDVGEAPHGR